MKYWVWLWGMLLIQCGNTTSICGQTKPEVLGSPGAIVYQIKMLPGDELLVANLADQIQLWNYQTKVMVNSWGSSKIIAIDHWGDRLAGVSKSGVITIWTLPDGKATLQKKISESPLISVAWIDSVFLVVGSDDGLLMKINGATGAIISTVENRVAVTALAQGPDNNLITGNADGVISMYNSKEMRLENTIKGHNSWIREIKFSKRGTFLTISDDGHYARWTPGKQIIRNRRESLGNWLLCADLSGPIESPFDVMAFGKRNGQITVTTGSADYTFNFNAIINGIGILKTKSPIISLVVGTHGQGMQLLKATSMKIRMK